MFAAKQKMARAGGPDISFDYIRGLADGKGCFTFSYSGSGPYRQKLPCFSIGMTARDRKLLSTIADRLTLRNDIYTYPSRSRRDGYVRDSMSRLVVRDLGQLKNVVVPLFYKKLIGHKAKIFEDWIATMASDPEVPERFKLIPRLYTSGFYERNFTIYS